MTYSALQTVDEQYLRSGGPTRASPRSPAAPSASSTASGGPGGLGGLSQPTPSRAGKRKSRDTDNKANLVRDKYFRMGAAHELSVIQAVKESTKTTRCKRPKVANTN